ncbi:hypothetical protein L9F63_005591, partial [Diploptera punctata]
IKVRSKIQIGTPEGCPIFRSLSPSSKKETAKKRHNTGRPEATDDGDKLRNCSIEEKRYEV